MQAPLKSQKGFIALYALLSLAFLVAVVVLVMAHWSGVIQTHRRKGGLAQAQRVAHAFIHRKLLEDRLRVPRYWIAPMKGEALGEEGARIQWRLHPLDGRWRVGARPWNPEWQSYWERLGARPEAVHAWQIWMEARRNGRDPASGIRGDLVTDPAFAQQIFEGLGLQARWGVPGRMWTLDEGGALSRLNFLGSDPEVLAVLSGVPKERLEEIQNQAAAGLPDASAAQALWRFDEQQAVEPLASIRPFGESLWTVELRLPALKEPILTRWRVSQEEGTPGNPWFKVRPAMEEAW